MEENEVELFSSSVEYEINQVCTMLNDNKIPFIRKDYGSGAYLSVYMGQSIQLKKVFVRPEDYDKAMEVISVFFSAEEQDIVENEDNVSETNEDKADISENGEVHQAENEHEIIEEEEEQQEKDIKKYNRMKRLLGALILGIPIAIIIAIIILGM